VKAHVPNSFPSPANRQFLKVRRERLTPAELGIILQGHDLCLGGKNGGPKCLEHCRVAVGESVIRAFSRRLTSPDDYAWRFTNEELAVIREETKATGARVGY
jgi:hypothetical protein